jgi:hypothetical protein
LAEQWTENPRVGGSIPPLATPHRRNREVRRLKELPDRKLEILHHGNLRFVSLRRGEDEVSIQDLFVEMAPGQSGEVFYALGDRALSGKTLLFSIDTVVCLI